ncbi:helix-turn-helix transcriptional regulator [Chitinophaga sedimenti]|uniref:winged helix-turn-helix transcriptional regulator n=1 Tax=Chitinophaga sedimenti TaxID=2033606 RepID=UPI00200379F1|nr:helix-turn-helix domain-containing protein [Chitinophaga sedimenti]MCK7557822.1 helix-turn-helix transcriptional regulator [Chitinophaga sedimenti]
MVHLYHPALGQVKVARFNELKKQVTGISQRMLTVTLRSLEENGLVSRQLFPEIPPRVEYTLTSSRPQLIGTDAAIVRMGRVAPRRNRRRQEKL